MQHMYATHHPPAASTKSGIELRRTSALILPSESLLLVLIHACVRDRDPTIVLCGFGWDGSDENKMQASFRMGRASFPHFIDLQRVSVAMGYHRYGLGSLTARVLGFELPKSRRVSMSNWEARRLTQGQVVYAALDALITGQIFRALRLWHSSTSACSTCLSPIGSLVQSSTLT